MSTHTDIFRGHVFQNTQFHLYIKSDINPLSLGDKVFILCMCVNSDGDTILYWSCDPSDFTYNPRGDTKNYGPAKVSYAFTSSNAIYTLQYENPEKKLVNLDYNNYNIYPINNNSTANVLYYSYTGGYNFKSSTGTVKWYFRLNVTTGSKTTGNTIFKDITSSSSYFKNLNTKIITLSNVVKVENRLSFESSSGGVIPNTGIVYIDDIPYSYHHVTDSNILILSKNSLFGASTGSATGACIYVRNDISNFEQLTNDTLPINFMPTTEHSYFAGNVNKITDMENHVTNDNKLSRFYDYSGNKIARLDGENGKLIFSSILIFVNSVLNKFNTTVYDKYINITGTLASGTETNTTISVFSNPQDAKQKIFYPYCGDNETCGSCMGKTLTPNICTTTNKTLELFKDNKPHLSSTVHNSFKIIDNSEAETLSLLELGKDGEDERITYPRIGVLIPWAFLSLGLFYYAYKFNSLLEVDFKNSDPNEKIKWALSTEHYDIGLLTFIMGIINISLGITTVLYYVNPGPNFKAPNKIKDKNPSKTYEDYQIGLMAISIAFGLGLAISGLVFYKEKSSNIKVYNKDRHLPFMNKVLAIGIFLFIFGVIYIVLGYFLYEESKELVLVHDQPAVSIACYIIGSICVLVACFFYFSGYYSMSKELRDLRSDTSPVIAENVDMKTLSEHRRRIDALEETVNNLKGQSSVPPIYREIDPSSVRPSAPPLERVPASSNLTELGNRLTVLENKLAQRSEPAAPTLSSITKRIENLEGKLGIVN